MKTIKLLSSIINLHLLVFITILTLLSNCNSSEDTILEDPGQEIKMTAIVGGVPWKASNVSAQTLQGLFNISGKAADGSTINLTMNGFEEGSYIHSNANPGNVITYLPDDTGSQAYVSIASGSIGRVDITEFNEQDSTVSGTFYMVGTVPSSGDTISVWEGTFTKIKFYLETVTVGNNFLKAKIDGTEWEAVQVVGTVFGNDLKLIGTDASASRTISINLPKNAAAGTYSIGSPYIDDYGALYNANSQTFLESSTGTLTISNHNILNKIIEGTFSFEAFQFLGPAEASITEGSFYVAY